MEEWIINFLKEEINFEEIKENKKWMK